jgi:crotonobetainyl-CoA:carnitine CoA-transferase CaiB-like acyl-CoA transferase
MHAVNTPDGLRPLAGAFEGLRVLDLTQNLPGPYCTMLLRSLGAEVVKVEPPRGEPARHIGHLFSLVNRGKKSVTLDLKEDVDIARLHRLVAGADVLVEGFRPGVMARFGADASAARAMNPRLIYCSISGFGQEGPHRDRPGHDLNFQALTGVCHMMRSADGTPRGAALPVADLSSSLTAFAAICAALYRREREGEGCELDVALSDTVASWAYLWSEGLTPQKLGLEAALPAAQDWLAARAEGLPGPLASVGRWISERVGERAAVSGARRISERLESSELYARIARVGLHALPHYGIYECRDGGWLSVGIVDEDKFWRELCRALGVGPLGELPLPARFLAGPALRATLAPIFARRPLAAWLQELDDSKIPVAPVVPLAEAIADPHLRTRFGAWTTPTLPSPFVLEGGLEAPGLGADNQGVFESWV